MTQLLRDNAWTWFQDLPSQAHELLTRHLAVPTMERKVAMRFGSYFYYQDPATPEMSLLYGSLVHHDRVPAGLTGHASAILTHYGYQHEVKDIRVRPFCAMPLWALDVKWRDYQNTVQKQIVNNDAIGVIDAPPRSGKTLMAIRAMDTFSQPALYVAPSVAIVQQTYDKLVECFGKDMCARLDGDARPEERNIEKHFVVATAASAVRLEREWFGTRGLLVIDEFHHAAAETYHRISDLASSVFHRLMFTGTHFRSGEDELAMAAVCSNVLFKISVGELVSNGHLAPFRVTFSPMQGSPCKPGDWATTYDSGVVDNEPRNHKIAFIANTLSANGIQTIVLVGRKRHTGVLQQMISGSETVQGGQGVLTGKKITDFRNGHFNTLIGTSVIGEGVDVPQASALIYAMAGGDTVGMMQGYFRPLTAREGKTMARVYDFRDLHNETLRRHADLRLAFARKHLGNCVVSL